MAEVLLLVSGALLAKQLSALRSTNTASRPRLEPPYDNSFDHEFDEDYETHPPSPPPSAVPRPVPGALPRGGSRLDLFRDMGSEGPPNRLGMLPGWARQTSGMPRGQRQEIVNDDPSQPYVDAAPVFTDKYRYHGARTLDMNQRMRGQGVGPVEDREFVRPPLRGGDEGYDEERGRAPIPRFHRYDLGDDKSTGLRDQGMSRGFAVGQAGRSAMVQRDAWEIMPDRTVAAVARNQHLPLQPASLSRNARLGTPAPLARNVVENPGLPSTGRTSFVMKGIMPPERDTTDRRFADGSVDAYTPQVGSRRGATVPRGLAPSVPALVERAGPGSIAASTKAHGAGAHAASAAGAGADRSGWRFSFQLRDLVNNTAPPRATTAAEVQPRRVHRPETRLDERPMVPNLPPQATTHPEKRVLFSDEERNDYKLDSKKLTVDLSTIRRPVESLGRADPNVHPSQRRDAQHQARVVDLSVNARAAAGSLARSAGVTEFRADNPRQALPERVTQLPNAAPSAASLGRSRAGLEFSANKTPVELSVLDRVEKKGATEQGHAAHGNVGGRAAVASRPAASTNFSANADQILFENDEIADRGGELILPPISGGNPQLRRDGPQDRLVAVSSADGAFRRRS